MLRRAGPSESQGMLTWSQHMVPGHVAFTDIDTGMLPPSLYFFLSLVILLLSALPKSVEKTQTQISSTIMGLFHFFLWKQSNHLSLLVAIASKLPNFTELTMLTELVQAILSFLALTLSSLYRQSCFQMLELVQETWKWEKESRNSEWFWGGTQKCGGMWIQKRIRGREELL